MNIRTADYVIIGAGSAGAALANRLTENGRHQVLLLEAGGETHPLSRVPISYARFINRPGRELALCVRARGRDRRAQHPGAARKNARRLERDQRHGVGARPAPGL